MTEEGKVQGADLKQETTSVPVTGKAVDGGRASDVDAALQKQLESQQAAYKGMQTNYNKLFEQAQGKDAQIGEMQAQLEELKRQFETVNQAKTATEKAAEEARAKTEELTTQYTATQAENDMLKLISSKYSNLSGMVGNLRPGETAEATEQMLAGMSKAVETAAQSVIQKQLGDYPPGGNISRGTPPSLESLKAQAVGATGKTEYGDAANAYYAALAASGSKSIPQPPRDMYDEEPTT